GFAVEYFFCPNHEVAAKLILLKNSFAATSWSGA
ncbi:MAG: hypothetical protein ACI976_003206, partial [Aureispira sp.]